MSKKRKREEYILPSDDILALVVSYFCVENDPFFSVKRFISILLKICLCDYRDNLSFFYKKCIRCVIGPIDFPVMSKTSKRRGQTILCLEKTLDYLLRLDMNVTPMINTFQTFHIPPSLIWKRQYELCQGNANRMGREQLLIDALENNETEIACLLLKDPRLNFASDVHSSFIPRMKGGITGLLAWITIKKNQPEVLASLFDRQKDIGYSIENIEEMKRLAQENDRFHLISLCEDFKARTF